MPALDPSIEAAGQEPPMVGTGARCGAAFVSWLIFIGIGVGLGFADSTVKPGIWVAPNKLDFAVRLDGKDPFMKNPATNDIFEPGASPKAADVKNTIQRNICYYVRGEL